MRIADCDAHFSRFLIPVGQKVNYVELLVAQLQFSLNQYLKPF